MMENSKTQYQNVLTQNRVIKKIHKLKIKLQDRIKNMREREREREREINFHERMWEGTANL